MKALRFIRTGWQPADLAGFKASLGADLAIQSFLFEKGVYPTQTSAIRAADALGLHVAIKETDSSWVATARHPADFAPGTLEVRRTGAAVIAIVGKQLAGDAFDHLRRWEAGVPIVEADSKAVKVLRDDSKMLVDVQDVQIEGYLSTFRETTEADRQGDYVESGAFKETIKKFMQRNPVLLLDHSPSVRNVAGQFVEMKEDSRGLRFRAEISNAPDMRDVRIKIHEGSLRTTSMGGIFHYNEDGRGIFKVDLWEGSLTPLPVNQDAIFQTRALDPADKHFIKSAAAYGGDYTLFRQTLTPPNLAGVAA